MARGPEANAGSIYDRKVVSAGVRESGSENPFSPNALCLAPFDLRLTIKKP